jgi:hypothetical protein
MTMFDRMDACYCEFMGGSLFGQDCMSADERKRQECVNPPPGDDDGPKRECGLYMHSESVNPSLMDAAFCHYVRPDPDCVGVLSSEGQCLCASDIPEADLRAQIGQQICGQVYCDPMSSSRADNAIFDVRTGCCQEIPYLKPLTGVKPSCSLAPEVNRIWQAFDRDALAPALVHDVRPLADAITRDAGLERPLNFYRAGYTSALGPAVERASFPDIGQLYSSDDQVMLNLEVLRAADAGCSNDRVQAFCTSDVLDNQPLGEIRLSQLDPGAFGEVQIPIRAELLDRCLPQTGTSARIGFAVDSCADSELRTALGDFTLNRPDVPWIERDSRPLCPLDPTGQREVFEVNVSPTTTAELQIAP